MQLLQSVVFFVKILCLVLFSLMVPMESFNPFLFCIVLSPFTLSQCFIQSLWFSAQFLVPELIKLIAVALTEPYFEG